MKKIQQLLKKYNFTPAKIRGQNFLIDEEILDAIVVASKISKDDKVVEIGPGFGFLTTKLATQAKQVMAIEIDSRAAAAINQELADCQNIEIINEDALKFDFAKHRLAPARYLLVANIPYQITGKIFEKFLLGVVPPSRAVLLMQKEVGERILSKETKQTFLSIVLQSAYAVREIAKVSREKFYPAPRVDSVALAFEFKRNLTSGFIVFLRRAFLHPKKKMMNNLGASAFRKYDLKSVFLELGIDLNTRPGDIKLGDWLKLGKKLSLLP